MVLGLVIWMHACSFKHIPILADAFNLHWREASAHIENNFEKAGLQLGMASG